jgi:CopG family nickel-responsive transcriptional regulator
MLALQEKTKLECVCGLQMARDMSWRSGMAELIRTGVSIEQDLLEKFDTLIAKRGYGNRSEALRDLIREMLVSEEVSDNKPVVATLSMIYDHHRTDLSNKLAETQHHHHDNVLAATHVHLDAKNCFEVVIMKGPAGEVKHMADHMLSLKGVKHGKLVMTSTGKDI